MMWAVIVVLLCLKAAVGCFIVVVIGMGIVERRYEGRGKIAPWAIAKEQKP